MKNTGIIRRLDGLGRIGIPKEIRDKFDIKEKTKVDISVLGSKIIMQKCEDSCFICNSNKYLIEFQNKLICKNCILKLTEQGVEHETKVIR